MYVVCKDKDHREEGVSSQETGFMLLIEHIVRIANALKSILCPRLIYLVFWFLSICNLM